MARWLDEFLHPAKKCARLGHRMIETRTTVYLYPPESGWRAVADRAVEAYEKCRRCGFETKAGIIARRGIQGLTLPGDGWDRLQADGRLARPNS